MKKIELDFHPASEKPEAKMLMEEADGTTV